MAPMVGKWEFSKEPQDYRMTVHLFGATSSPSCASYALKQCTNEPCDFLYDPELARHAINKNMYVDDLASGAPNVEKALLLIKDCKTVCETGGFNLTKFQSNSKKLLDQIPLDNRNYGEEFKLSELQNLPIDKALGIQWCTPNNSFSFQVTLKDTPLMRKGIQFVPFLTLWDLRLHLYCLERKWFIRCASCHHHYSGMNLCLRLFGLNGRDGDRI